MDHRNDCLLWLQRNWEMAKELQDGVEYPMGGYAPGGYMHHCHSCGAVFLGDKGAICCEPCGVQQVLWEQYVIHILDFVIGEMALLTVPNGKYLLDAYRRKVFDDFMSQQPKTQPNG